MCPTIPEVGTDQKRHSHEISTAPNSKAELSRTPSLREEAGNVILLVVLYCLQGVPLGLSMGSMPFLLQAHSSFTSIGIFSIAAYPYSCKLLWSPIVDSIFNPRFGRRKTWIVPLQFLSAAVFILFAEEAEAALLSSDIIRLSAMFFVLVLLAATQDIAVDGWALNLLSKGNLGYTSTCQTVGMNAGFFLSFTVFLAFNDKDFCNQYFRSVPADEGFVSLSGYMKMWGVIYVLVTLYLILFKKEKTDIRESDLSVRQSYARLWSVAKLPAVIRLTSVLVLCRIGSLVAEGAASLKLLEKGVSKETLSGLVLFEFPIELISALFAGKLVENKDALSPFLLAYYWRLILATGTTCLVYFFPVGVANWFDSPLTFFGILLLGMGSSLVGTVMFTAQGAFFSQISDSSMGGAYMTLLNALANTGSSLPRLFLFWMMDQLTVRECMVDGEWREDLECPNKKEDALALNECTEAAGECAITKDGFYPVAFTAIGIGFLLGTYFSATFRYLRSIPKEAWRAGHKKRP